MISPNSTKNQSQKIPSFFLSANSQHPKNEHAKSTKNLNISLGAHESPYKFNSSVMVENKSSIDVNKRPYARSYKFGERLDQYASEYDVNKKLESIATENSRLKEENEFLRKELEKIRKIPSDRLKVQSSIEKHNSLIPSRSQSPSHKSGDLRNTIKKEVPATQMESTEVKELRSKLELLAKQCRMHEEIIDKMETTIRRLTDENKFLSNNKKYYQSDERDRSTKKEELSWLKDKVNLVMKEYSELESKMHSNELEWVIWKEQWITEKNIYLNKIKQLENKIKDKENDEKKY